MINVRFEIWHSILGTFLENKVALQKKIINKTWFPISKKIRKTKNDIENQNFTIYEAIFIIEH